MLVAVVEALTRNLGELTGAVEAGRGEGVGGARVHGPVRSCGVVACGIQGFTVVEEAFLVAVP